MNDPGTGPESASKVNEDDTEGQHNDQDEENALAPKRTSQEI